MVIPVVVGALGAMADRLSCWLAQIPGTISEAIATAIAAAIATAIAAAIATAIANCYC